MNDYPPRPSQKTRVVAKSPVHMCTFVLLDRPPALNQPCLVPQVQELRLPPGEETAYFSLLTIQRRVPGTCMHVFPEW